MFFRDTCEKGKYGFFEKIGDKLISFGCYNGIIFASIIFYGLIQLFSGQYNYPDTISCIGGSSLILSLFSVLTGLCIGLAPSIVRDIV